MKIARIGVLLDTSQAERHWSYGINIFDKYIGEVLAHEGITYEWLDSVERISKYTFDIVIVALAKDEDRTREVLTAFMEKGGIVISYGGLGFMSRAWGYRNEPDISAGYVFLPEAYGEERPLRYIGASPWVAKKESAVPCEAAGVITVDSPEAEPYGPWLQQFIVGEGRLERWSVQAVASIVYLQQGRGPILEDGSPPADGSAVIDEGILKADDGIMQDYLWDRKTTETGASYFAHPYADLWREAILKHLVGCALERGLTVPMLAAWPEGTKHVAMISHDSDWSPDEAGKLTMDVLRECGIRSTWCMIQTGYSGQVHDRIRQEGHELAMHFNAMKDQGGAWGQGEFARQHQWLTDNLPVDRLYSNKNHYTCFQGWGELFEWCEQYGLSVDQTRGPSKKGNVGFLFGTCKPYVPIAWANDRNRFYEVIELGFLTQDIPAWTDMSVVEPFIEQVKRVEGVAHFLFHQGRIYRDEEVRSSLKEVVRKLKVHGFDFWTSRQIGEWQRLRRKVKITGVDEQGVAYQCVNPLPSTVVRIPLPEGEGQIDTDSPYRAVDHLGFRCLEITIASV